MKKLLSLFLCLILACGMLVSCDESDIGSYLPNYDYRPEVVEDLTLNMYIITENDTVKNAKDTVSQMISAYTTTEFHTDLNVFYFTPDEYSAKVMAAVNSNEKDAANIILVNSESMMKDLMKSNKLADLTSYLDSDKYGTLNVQIAEALLNGSKIEDKFYSIPNNHVIGQYEYLVINKEVAIQTLKFSPSEVSSYKSLEDAATLIAKIDELYGKDSYKQYVYTVKGLYEDKADFESMGNVCNVVTYPTVTSEVAFSSAFAVVNRDEKHNERAMQIIYALNTDTELRNMLQYGVRGTNYTVSETGDVIRVKEGENVYSMNLLYTGDVFRAAYCTELNWYKEVAENGANQNKEAVN